MNQNSTLTTARKPYRWYAVSVCVLLLLGLANSAYLAYLHYQNYTDIFFSSFCALSQAVNCDTVSQSPWSILFGLPLAYWGFLAYTLFLGIFLGTFAQHRNAKKLWYLLFPLSLGFTAFSVYLAYISTAKINAYCILCILSYGINFALLFLSWIVLRRFCSQSFFRGFASGAGHCFRSIRLLLVFLCIVLLFFGLRVGLPEYWQYPLLDSSAPPDLPSGLTSEGNPWIGAEQPSITIHEYADYQCFQCSKMHLFLRRLIVENPEKIRLVHHHYPLDHTFNNIVVPEPFHIGSGKMAMVAIYAASKGKFWQMNDVLYAMGRKKEPFNTRTLHEKTGIPSGELAMATKHPNIRAMLLYDIRRGMKQGITGTPSFVIDGEVYEGAIPADLLKNILR